jgi:hypothetical protein
MAATVAYFPCCMAGMTFLRPMAAVLRTPQRSFVDVDIDAHHKGIERKDAIVYRPHAIHGDNDLVVRGAELACVYNGNTAEFPRGGMCERLKQAVLKTALP